MLYPEVEVVLGDEFNETTVALDEPFNPEPDQLRIIVHGLPTTIEVAVVDPDVGDVSSVKLGLAEIRQRVLRAV